MDQNQQTQPTTNAYPVSINVEYPERSSRLLALATLLWIFKFIMIIPSFFVLAIMGFGAFFAFIFSQFAVLFTGHYPRKPFNFIVGYLRWQLRISAFIYGLTDKYPPFSIEK